MNLTIKTITIVRGKGPDVVYLETNLPNPMWPHEGNLSVKFQASAGTGSTYAIENFGIFPEVVDMGA